MKETVQNANNVLFIAATHGDEQFSFDVLENITKTFPKAEYNYDWIVGNPKAVEKESRYVEVDLNRSAPGDLESVFYEERRAAEIMELSKRYKFVVDIHGTVADSGIVTIIPYPTLQNLVLAASLPIERNVIWYAKASLKKGPLVQFTDCPGIEIECGPKSSLEIQKELEEILGTFLTTRFSDGIDQMLEKVKGKEFYYVYDSQPEDGKSYSDFELTQDEKEEFYPFLSNQYSQVACYKMKKVTFEDLFLI